MSIPLNLATFLDDAAEWKRFVWAVGRVIFLPLGLVALACEFYCWQSGEFIDDRIAAERQAADPDLLWFAHHDIDAVHFKMFRVQETRPEVLVMGQSRAGGWRGAMFQPYTFYNLSRVSWPVETFTQILRHLPSQYAPKVIIFSLDYFLFQRVLDSSEAEPPRFELPSWKRHLHSLRDAFSSLCAAPSRLWAQAPAHVIGINARLTGHGFRQDGSEAWPAAPGAKLGGDPEIFKRAYWKGDPLVNHASAMNAPEIAGFEEFANLARARGIQLIGVQMPMYRPLAQVVENSPDYRILADFRAHLAAGYFDRLGIITFDFLDFPPYSGDYHYFLDPIHPTEAIDAAILLKISGDPRVHALLPRLDMAALRLKVERDRSAQQHVSLY